MSMGEQNCERCVSIGYEHPGSWGLLPFRYLPGSNAAVKSIAKPQDSAVV